METKDCACLSIMFKKHLVCLYVWIKIIFFIVIYYFNQNDTREQNMEKFFNDIKWIVWYERIVKIFISFILHCEKICLYVSKIYIKSNLLGFLDVQSYHRAYELSAE